MSPQRPVRLYMVCWGFLDGPSGHFSLGGLDRPGVLSFVPTLCSLFCSSNPSSLRVWAKVLQTKPRNTSPASSSKPSSLRKGHGGKSVELDRRTCHSLIFVPPAVTGQGRKGEPWTGRTETCLLGLALRPAGSLSLGDSPPSRPLIPR